MCESNLISKEGDLTFLERIRVTHTNKTNVLVTDRLDVIVKHLSTV